MVTPAPRVSTVNTPGMIGEGRGEGRGEERRGEERRGEERRGEGRGEGRGEERRAKNGCSGDTSPTGLWR